VTAAQALARPTKTILLRDEWGRRERGTDAKEAWWSNPLRSPLAFATVEGVPVHGMAQPFAGLCRNVDLGRSVGWHRVPPVSAALPTTSDVPWVAEEGNAVRMRASKRMHQTRGASPHARALADDTSFARSSDPCRSFATSESFGETRRRWRARVGIAVGKTWRKPGGTGTGTFAGGPCAARRASPLSQGSSRETSEKEGRHGARPSEDRQSSRFVPARRIAVAEVDRRRLVSKKLVKRAPKRAAGASERGPRAPRHPAVTRRMRADGRNGESCARVAPHEREQDRVKAQGDVRASSSGTRIRQKRCGGRGTGAVMATGSYEGFLSMEGTSGHLQPAGFHEPSASVASAVPSDFQPTCPARRAAGVDRTHEGA
jgi:hypothetical protein